MVSCCGQAKDEPSVTQPFGAGPGIIETQPRPQPGLPYNNSGFQAPNVPSPPIAHPHDQNPFSNGIQPPMRFGAASPPLQSVAPTFTGTTYNGQPPMREFGTASPPLPPGAGPGPNFTGSPFIGQPMREFGAGSPPLQPGGPTFTGTTYNGQPPSQQPSFTGTTYNGSNFNSVNQTITRPKSTHSPNSPSQANPPIQDEGKMSISIDFGVYPHVASLHSLILVQAQHSLVL